MKNLGTKLLVIATFLTANYASAESARYSVTGVSANTTLALYAWPDHSAERLNTIPHDAENISATGEFISLAPTNWVQVNWGNQAGWVDLALLKPMPTSNAVQTSVITTKTADEGFVYDPANSPVQSTAAAPQPVQLPSPISAVSSSASNQDNLPWNNVADTIYHDPSSPDQAKPLQPRMSLAQTSLTVARPANNGTGEMAGDRYGDINATMTVMFTDNGAEPE